MVIRRLWGGTPLQKQERKGGRRGLRPWPLRCLSQFLSERKERLLNGRMCAYESAFKSASFSPMG